MESIRVLLLVLLLALGSGLFAPSRLPAANFHGQVVDAETGEPLEGAVVAVIWFRQTYNPLCMDSCSVFHRAREVTTDTQGKFVIDISAGLQSFAVRSRHAVIVKPGYEPMIPRTNKTSDTPFVDPVVKLSKLKTVEEARKSIQERSLKIDICHADRTDWCVPQRSVPKLVRLLEIQRKLFDPKPLGHFGPE
jgi:hypothetical protein